MRRGGLSALAVGAVALPFVLGAAQPSTLVRQDAEELAVISDPDIVESSGLAVVEGRWVTVNDSGDAGRVFTVDPATGETVGVTSWAQEPVDVEAVAPVVEDGRPTGEVWVADIGDNLAQRASVALLRVPVGEGDREVEPERVELVYPDGPRDAESLLTDPGTGRLYVVSKGVLGGEFYAVPEVLATDGPTELERLAAAPAIATDAAFLPDGRHVVVRSYTDAVVHAFPTLEAVGSFRLPQQPQGEGIGVDPDDPGAVLLTTEGVDQPVLRVELPADVAAAMEAGVPGGGSSGASSGGSSGEGASSEGSAAERERLPGWVPWAGGAAAAAGAVVRRLRGV